MADGWLKTWIKQRQKTKRTKIKAKWGTKQTRAEQGTDLGSNFMQINKDVGEAANKFVGGWMGGGRSTETGSTPPTGRYTPDTTAPSSSTGAASKGPGVGTALAVAGLALPLLLNRKG